MSVRQYKFEKTLDRGTFAKVKLAENTLTKELVAVKIIKKVNCKETSIKKEIAILRACIHSHIVKYYDLVQDEKNYYIIMEYIDGVNLFDRVSNNPRIPEPLCKKYFVQIVSAIRYCHSQLIAHRDLKLENVMLTSDDNVKIIDFGLSTHLNLSGKRHNTWCGSIMYLPPEICTRNEYTSPRVDIWCLGVMLFALLTKFMPFGGKDDRIILENIINCKYQIPEFVSRNASDLIRKMLRKEPNLRISLEQVRNHRWLRDAPDTPLEIPRRRTSLGGDTSISLIIIDKMEQIGFDGDEAMRSIRHGDQNEYTAVYRDIRDRMHYGYTPGLSDDSDDDSKLTTYRRGHSESDLKSSMDDMSSPSLARNAKVRKNGRGQKFLEKLFTKY